MLLISLGRSNVPNSCSCQLATMVWPLSCCVQDTFSEESKQVLFFRSTFRKAGIADGGTVHIYKLSGCLSL